MKKSQNKQGDNKASNTHSRTYQFTKWLSLYNGRPKTKNTYYSGIKSFLTCINKTDLRKTTPKELEKLATSYIEETRSGSRDYFDDLVTFIQSWGSKAPMSLDTYISATRNFLLYCCDLELDTKEKRALRGMMPKGMGEAQTQDGILTREKLRAILLHSDIRMKALMLFLESSGIRVGEALQLKLGDVKLGPEPNSSESFAPTVFVRAEYAKEGHSYTSFLNVEAVEALNEWLKVRDNYLASGIFKRGQNLFKKNQVTVATTPPSADQIFPFTYISAAKAFVKVLKEAGLFVIDPRTGRCIYHLHLFRKYFTSQMKLRVPPEMVEAMTGHRGYMGGVYNNQYTLKDYVEAYHKGEPQLLILQDTTKLEAANQKLDLQNQQFLKVSAYNEALANENKGLIERMARWDAYFAKNFGQGFEQTAEKLSEIGKAQQIAEKKAKEDQDEMLMLFGEPQESEPEEKDAAAPKSKRA